MHQTHPGRLDPFFSMSPYMACVLGEEHRFEDANRVWEKALGYRSDELIGRSLLDLIHEDDRARAAESIADLRAHGGAGAFEVRGVCKDRSSRWLLFHAWIVEDRIYAVVRDRTSARHIEAQLQAEVEFNKAFLDASPMFFVAICNDGTTLMMNDFMREALGYTPEEVIGRNYMDMCVPEREREGLLQVFSHLSAATGPTVNENHVLTKDGRELLVEWRGRAHFDANGEFEYLLGTGVEIGERRRMEEALQRSEQKLSFHIKETPLGVIEWDREFRILDWNASATRIFGFEREEMLGQKPVGLIIDESQVAAIRPMWVELMSYRDSPGQPRLSPEAVRGKNENRTKDGRTIICEWYNTPLRDEHGVVVGIMSMVDDVTDQEQLATELRRRERAQAETIELLSTPVIEVWEGILTLPIIGALDDDRAARMTESLLEAIVRTRAAYTIVDLTGVSGVDAANADHLLRMVRATQLLGSRCLISGISPGAAQAMVNLGSGLAGLTTFGTLRDALSFALANARSSSNRGRAAPPR